MSRMLEFQKTDNHVQPLSRKGKYRKENKHIKIKFLIGVLFLIVTVGGGMGIAFADADINGLLTNWFNQKSSESISSIEKSISTEKDLQKERLKQELQIEIQNAQKQLSDFTEQEKNQRIQAIRDYANQLIANLKIDNSGKEKAIQNQMNAIVKQAKAAMDQIAAKQQEKEQHNDNSNDNSQVNANKNTKSENGDSDKQ